MVMRKNLDDLRKLLLELMEVVDGLAQKIKSSVDENRVAPSRSWRFTGTQ